MKNRIQYFREDREFYLYALGIALPLIFQNLITNFVSMLDNIMVGQVGTAQMSGVSIVNQFIFVFNLTLFGGLSGASIFGTQFFGKGDDEGQRYTFRFRLILTAIVCSAGALIFYLFGTEIISLFLSGDDSPEQIQATLAYGKEYLGIMILTLFPFGFGQAYASVIRECGETKVPMYGAMSAIGVNLLLDYGLIFGKLGFPQLGVAGAAIATLAAKCIEALVMIVWAHTHPEKNRYLVGAYKGFHIPGSLAKEIIIKGCPLLINEFLWSMGMSLIAQCYSVRGLEVVAARNISSTITNLFSVVYVQMGSAIGIIVGARLGAGQMQEAKDCDRKLTIFSIVVTSLVALCLLPFAWIFPGIYNTEESIKELAAFFILVQALAMPVCCYTNAAYFTLRSGGKTGITFLFDFGATWFMMFPLAFILTHFTGLDIRIILSLVISTEAIKAVIGYFMLKSGIWVNNIVG